VDGAGRPGQGRPDEPSVIIEDGGDANAGPENDEARRSDWGADAAGEHDAHRPAAADAAPTAPANPQNPTFRTTVYYVSNTVIVRDKSGKFIPDLKQSEFKLYEDGVEQKIQVFTPWIGGRAMGSVASVPRKQARPI
jgi:hypothetical protein